MVISGNRRSNTAWITMLHTVETFALDLYLLFIHYLFIYYLLNPESSMDAEASCACMSYMTARHCQLSSHLYQLLLGIQEHTTKYVHVEFPMYRAVKISWYHAKPTHICSNVSFFIFSTLLTVHQRRLLSQCRCLPMQIWLLHQRSQQKRNQCAVSTKHPICSTNACQS